MKYFAYAMTWICTATVIICAIVFEDAVWTVLGLLVPLCIPFPKSDAADMFVNLFKTNDKKQTVEKE